MMGGMQQGRTTRATRCARGAGAAPTRANVRTTTSTTLQFFFSLMASCFFSERAGIFFYTFSPPRCVGRGSTKSLKRAACPSMPWLDAIYFTEGRFRAGGAPAISVATARVLLHNDLASSRLCRGPQPAEGFIWIATSIVVQL